MFLSFSPHILLIIILHILAWEGEVVSETVIWVWYCVHSNHSSHHPGKLFFTLQWISFCSAKLIFFTVWALLVHTCYRGYPVLSPRYVYYCHASLLPCSNVSEAVIFLFLGISLYESRSIDYALIGLSIVFCLVFRPLGECALTVLGSTPSINTMNTFGSA